MDLTYQSTVTEVAAVVTSVLGIEGRHLDAGTPLFGSLPELDSMAVVELMAALEERFGITIDEADVTESVFESVGSLARLVDARRG